MIDVVPTSMRNIKVLNTGNVKYRLGDAILLRNSAAYPERGVLNPIYKGTIGYEYCSTYEKRLIDYVNDLVNKHIALHSYPVPDEKEIVVHLRIGDNGPPRKQRDKLIRSYELNKLLQLIKNVSDDFSKKITIVTAMHSVENPDIKDYEIINKLCETISVDIRSSENVDEDFCYLVKAKKLIVTKGCFSELAAMCNQNEVFRFVNRFS